MRSWWAIALADVLMVAAFVLGPIVHDYELAFGLETVVVLLLLEHFYVGPGRREAGPGH